MSIQSPMDALVRNALPLSSASILRENSVLREQQRQFNAFLPLASFVMLINASATALFLSAFSPSILVAAWYGAILACAAYVSWYARRTGRRPMPRIISGRSFQRSEAMLLLIGCIWGSSIFLPRETAASATYFVFMVNIGMACGFSAITAACPRFSMRFTMPTLMLSCAYFMIVGDVMGVCMALLTIILAIALLLGGVQSERQLRENIESWAAANQARRDLVDAIEAVDDAFAIHDPSGKPTLTNARYRQWFPNGASMEAAGESDVQRISDSTWLLRSFKSTTDGRMVSIHKDVTSLKQREHQLIAARREAEDADAAKARFLSTMSQELRAPLNIINSFSQIMGTGSKITVTPEDMRAYADAILGAGEHLLTVINDIIEFSQVGSDRYMHDPNPHDVLDLIEKAASLSRQFNATGKACDIEISVADAVGSLIVDEAAFRRVLMSLISNAIKFGGPQPHVVVKAALQAETGVMITVRDFGEGIAAPDLERVFEPFYQCASTRARTFSGTGLGLTLARELVRLHGGTLVLASREGTGTTATIMLPLSAHLAPAAKGAGDGRRPSPLSAVA